MMQLTDGRLVVRTPKGINLYDGRRFSLIPLPAEKAENITKYKGQTHLYADSQDRVMGKGIPEDILYSAYRGPDFWNIPLTLCQKMEKRIR